MPAAVLQASFIGHGVTGEQMVTTMHFLQTVVGTAVDPTNITAVAAAVDNLWVPRMLDGTGQDFVYDQTRVAVVFGDDVGTAADVLTQAGSIGNGSGNSGPYERGILLRKLSGGGGRGGRGRMFLPMTPVGTFTADGQRIVPSPDEASYLLIIGLFTTNIVVAGVGTFHPYVFNRTVHSGNLLTAGGISSLCGIQRRRRFGIGS